MPKPLDFFKASHSALRLVVYAGPTGGHVFPAQSFSEGFRKRFPDSRIDLVTCHRAKSLVDKMPQDIFRSVLYLPEFGFPSGLSWKTLKPFILFPYLFLQAFFFLKRTKPDLCVGFGSFVSYPGMMTAHWLKIPTLIHEQNKVPGKATHWLVPHMDVVAESFEGTRFLQNPKVLHTVGLPLRSFIVDSATKTRKESIPRPFTLLVVGGSQGAQGLNRAVADAIAVLSDEERSKIAVIHITGKRDQAWVAERYEKLAISNEVHPFYGAMDELFQKVDLAITRAGANTLFELAVFGVPALVIPYPHAGGHQKYNAQSFSEKGGLIFHDEDPEAKDWLAENLRNMIETPGSLAGIAKAMRGLAKPKATDELIEIARELIKTHEDRTR
ncbi:MAG: UDP-N-acetylglucosamine--N-acetylmuramyl-(pentapeptide) pyrophosphoryl-undecaprenol N-acetylglucosamine transferase [Candidatus Omnitrophica bacterium]|nr:UDP-N-acetylglucosamine--N-acetylmuramyl-(pentapeptide) pyrophosphoryl-undecaprenol N-acetylglucosamine transferase [Candidatus Omnitrophota bacterium]